MCNYKKLDSSNILPFLFFPRHEPISQPPEGAINIDIEVDKNVTLGCRFYTNSKTSATIVYFHGNGEITTEHDDIATQYLQLGYNLFVASYRGYGWSTGTPTASNLLNDAKHLFTEVQKLLKREEYCGPIFVMGRSLGSACAIEVVSSFAEDIKGLLVESGFADTIPLLINLGAVTESQDMTEDDGFCNIAKITEITVPTFILHGSLDQIIPVGSAEKLQANAGARNKQFHVIPGADHNSMMSTGGELYFQTIKKFIDDVTGESNWRRKRKALKSNTNQDS